MSLLSLNMYAIQEFQKKILDWYELNRRDLPWRRTREPYRILVSEVMLQQTQVSRVIPKYEEWFRVFPTLESLVKASVADVLRIWSGLGYNRRALNLQRCAGEIWKGLELGIKNQESRIRRIDGWPETEEGLMRLPGIGKYTARALLCFAFDKQVAVVDTNVKKVILTQFQISNFKFQISKAQKELSDKEIWEVAEGLVPVGRAYDWNQALMDYASAVLKQEKIPIAKQSTFVGSRRYYRGKLVKVLLERETLSLVEVGKLFDKEGEQSWAESILADLTKEGFVRVEEGKVKLK